MKEKLKTSYYFLQKILRRDLALLNRIRREDFVVVLNFHQISPHRNPYWSPLNPKIFDTLLTYVKENFEIILFRDLAHTRSEKPFAILSFDDGYYDFIEYAAPILAKHKVRANMNIIPSCAESGEPIWNVKLYDFLNHAPRNLINEICFNGFDYHLKDDSHDSKIQYGLKISRFLKNRPRIEREKLVVQLENLMQRCEFEMTRMMTADEIQQIAEVHEIGAHSYSHESMGFESNEFFKTDVQRCSEYFNDSLGIPMEIYAFPNGSFRAEQCNILKDFGVSFLLTVGEQYARRESFVFPRFTIYGSSELECQFQTLGINCSK